LTIESESVKNTAYCLFQSIKFK